MIKKNFVRGSDYIKVKIEERKITFMTNLVNNQPIEIDLDKLEEEKTKKMIKQMKADKKMLKELSKLKTEKDMFVNLKQDLNKSGWKDGTR